MKTHLTNVILNKIILFSLFFSLIPRIGQSAEFVILNDVITYPNATDDNGFYFFYYNSSMPANWTTPNDYVNGEVWTRYEIISQATSTLLGLQFGIWQKLPPVTGTLYENMASVNLLYGPGTVATDHSSPSTWWTYNGGADFTKMDQVWHFGINPYKMDPYQQQIRQENPEVWAERFTYWFPMTVKVTVVAVSAGSTFSGWNTYLGVKPATPSYTINYSTSKTNQVVPSTDEYSYSSGMSPAYSGTGVALDLLPGQTIYFRTKAEGVNPESDIQTLSVPARPAAPAVTINYAAIKTNEVIGSNVEYSTDISMSGAASGSNALLDLTPGTAIYFRVKQTVSSFASLITSLDVPERPATPAITANFLTEYTSAITPDVEWSNDASMASASTGQGSPIALVPATDLYFRVKATESSFPSLVQHLVVPSRPASPLYTINFSTEKTNEPVATKDDYSTHSNMSLASSGSNATITLNPGTDLYFRTRASAVSFASAIQTLDIPSRPQAPVFSINFTEGTTNESVSATIEYSTEADFSGAEDGTGEPLTLDPGNNLFFRQKAGSSSFQSGTFELEVPACNYLGYSGPGTIITTYFTAYAILTDDEKT